MSRARPVLLGALLVTVTLAGREVWRGSETRAAAQVLQPGDGGHVTGPVKVTVRDLPPADPSPKTSAGHAAVTLQYIAALIDSLPCLHAADANSDSQTNAFDAALILQFAARLIDRLPPT